MAPVLTSTKEQLVLTAERLFGEYGIDGVSLRQIGAAAGSAGHSSVQYHFGNKTQLIAAVFQYRVPQMEERRRILVARRRPDDVRSWLECYVLPIIEQGELQGSHYLSFVAQLLHLAVSDRPEWIPEETGTSRQELVAAMDGLLTHLDPFLRRHRIDQAIRFSVHESANRERAQTSGVGVPSFALYVADLLDGLVGFLEAPASPATESALEDAELTSSGFSFFV